MNVAVLRVEGSKKALRVLRKSLSLNVVASWKKGRKNHFGSKYKKSGFNACVADKVTTKQMLKKVRKFIVKCNARKIFFSGSDLSVVLDIGVGVGCSKQFTASVKFSPEELKCFSDIGLDLEISSYPVCNKED